MTDNKHTSVFLKVGLLCLLVAALVTAGFMLIGGRQGILLLVATMRRAKPGANQPVVWEQGPAETLEKRQYISYDVAVRLYCEAVFSTTPHAFVTGANPSTMLPFTTDHIESTSFGLGAKPDQLEACTVAS